MLSCVVNLATREKTNETERLNVYLNKGQMAYLEQLRKQMTWGNSRPEVLLRLLDERFRQLIKENELIEEN